MWRPDLTLYTRQHLIGTERIYEGVIFAVRKDSLKHPQSSTVIGRELVEHNGGVVIACQPAPGKVILINQYRYVVDEELIELPAGRVEPGEDRLAAAQRELTEETGYRARTWTLLSHMYSAPGFCTEMLTFFHATDLEWQGKNLDEDEETEVREFDLEEAWLWARQGKIRDAKTIAGLGLLIHP